MYNSYTVLESQSADMQQHVLGTVNGRHMDAPLLLDSMRPWSDEMPAGPESECSSKADGHGCVLGHVRFERPVGTKADGQMQCSHQSVSLSRGSSET